MLSRSSELSAIRGCHQVRPWGVCMRVYLTSCLVITSSNKTLECLEVKEQVVVFCVYRHNLSFALPCTRCPSHENQICKTTVESVVSLKWEYLS